MNEYVTDTGEIDGAKVLEIELGENDADASTIKSYLIALLTKLWAHGEGFSGKRPFGNSGWEYDLYKPLVMAGAASGTMNEYGDIDGMDDDECSRLIFAAIEAL